LRPNAEAEDRRLGAKEIRAAPSDAAITGTGTGTNPVGNLLRGESSISDVEFVEISSSNYPAMGEGATFSAG